MKNNTPDSEVYSKEELAYFKALEDGIDDGSTHFMPKEELAKAKIFYAQVATNTINKMNKKKSLSLRLYENDILNIKAIAMEKGLPYQTFIASIIHQIATKQIKV